MQNNLSTWLYSANADFIEDLYESYLADPDSVSDEWQKYFNSLNENDSSPIQERSHSAIRQKFLNLSTQKRVSGSVAPETSAEHQKQVSVLQLINAHRFRGHQQANLDPLNQYVRPAVPELDPEFHDLTAADMDKTFNTGSLFADKEIPLKQIINIIRKTFCGNIGA